MTSASAASGGDASKLDHYQESGGLELQGVDMDNIPKRQRVLIRVIVLAVILVVLALMGLLRQNAPIVH
jgi:hypothetical protein